MRFISSAIHCAARSPACVPGPRPSNRSSAIARVRALRSAVVSEPVVSGCAGMLIGAAATAPKPIAATSILAIGMRKLPSFVERGVEPLALRDELALTDHAEEIRDRNLARMDGHHARGLDAHALTRAQKRHVALGRRRCGT